VEIVVVVEAGEEGLARELRGKCGKGNGLDPCCERERGDGAPHSAAVVTSKYHYTKKFAENFAPILVCVKLPMQVQNLKI
jgi:hypothetical protein